MNTAISAEGSQGPLGAPLRKGVSSQPDNLAKAATNLDIPTPKSDEKTSSEVPPPTPKSDETKRILSRRCRRFYNRVFMGLKLPGHYYFITLTSTPTSPPIKKSWNPLRLWINYHRPGTCWAYCITLEGHGVIHMIIRLGKGEKRIDAKELREYWKELTGADQVWLDHVPESKKNDLASYISDQRHKKKLGGELAWQDDIVRWRWSKGWLPKGFTVQFPRVWVRLMAVSQIEREKAIADWLMACHVDENNVLFGPGVRKGVVTWPEREPVKPSPPEAKIFDKQLDEILAAGWDWPEDCLDSDPYYEDPVIKAHWKARSDARNFNSKYDGVYVGVD